MQCFDIKPSLARNPKNLRPSPQLILRAWLLRNPSIQGNLPILCKTLMMILLPERLGQLKPTLPQDLITRTILLHRNRRQELLLDLPLPPHRAPIRLDLNLLPRQRPPHVQKPPHKLRRVALAPRLPAQHVPEDRPAELRQRAERAPDAEELARGREADGPVVPGRVVRRELQLEVDARGRAVGVGLALDRPVHHLGLRAEGVQRVEVIVGEGPEEEALGADGEAFGAGGEGDLGKGGFDGDEFLF